MKNKTLPMKTFLSFILLCVFHFNCSAQWVELNVGNVNATFTDVYAITPDIVVVVGSNGTIMKTTDGGATWLQKVSGTNEALRKVHFSTPSIGYIIGTQGTFLKTNDGGENWFSLNTGHSVNFYDISCVNENLIFISTDNGLIKSEDGGGNWSNLITAPYKDKIQFINNNIGFVGRSSTMMNYEIENDIAKTLDGGQTWQDVVARSPFGFLDENLGFFYFEGLHKTTNGGLQFYSVSNNAYPTLSDIFVLNENTIWGIFYWQTLDFATPVRGILKSTGTGEYSTYMLPHIHGYNLEKIHFANENIGYIVGSKSSGNSSNGLIWKNSTGINTNLASNENEKIDIIKIFPNPTSDKINITINNKISNKFSIILTDLSGKLVHNQNYSNKKKVNIDVQGFAKGTYILTIQTQDQIYSQKLIIK